MPCDAGILGTFSKNWDGALPSRHLHSYRPCPCHLPPRLPPAEGVLPSAPPAARHLDTRGIWPWPHGGAGAGANLHLPIVRRNSVRDTGAHGGRGRADVPSRAGGCGAVRRRGACIVAPRRIRRRLGRGPRLWQRRCGPARCALCPYRHCDRHPCLRGRAARGHDARAVDRVRAEAAGRRGARATRPTASA